LAGGADQRTGMIDRFDLLELHQAGAGHVVDRLAGGVRDEMKMESVVVVGHRPSFPLQGRSVDEMSTTGPGEPGRRSIAIAPGFIPANSAWVRIYRPGGAPRG